MHVPPFRLPASLALACAALVLTSVSSVRAEPNGKDGGATEITFSDLRFVTAPPKQIEVEGRDTTMPSYADQIPEKVAAYHKKRVRIRGYMMPTVLEGNGVREFIVVTSPLVCCYGQSPDINEYIVVRMVGKPAPLLENVPLKFEGVLKVGDIYQDGYWTGIYALECEDVKV